MVAGVSRGHHLAGQVVRVDQVCRGRVLSSTRGLFRHRSESALEHSVMARSAESEDDHVGDVRGAQHLGKLGHVGGS